MLILDLLTIACGLYMNVYDIFIYSWLKRVIKTVLSNVMVKIVSIYLVLLSYVYCSLCSYKCI